MAVLAYKGGFFHILVLCNGAENSHRRQESNFPKKFFNYKLILSQLQAFQEIYMER
jgi:hypothetical protein